MNARGLLMCGAMVLGTTLAATAADNATIKGKVVYKGEPLKRIYLKMDADATCAALHTDKVKSDNFIRNKDTGALANAIVYVAEGLGDKKFDPPATKVTIDQNGCTYKPHVLTMQTGQTLIIKNSDNTSHNIHSLSEKNPQFNIVQAKAGLTNEETLKKAEIFHVKCDVHGWMSSYIGVFDHPFHAVTGEDGVFELKNLPPGKYKIVAFHEAFDDPEAKFNESAATVEVTVGAGETKEIELVIDRTS